MGFLGLFKKLLVDFQKRLSFFVGQAVPSVLGLYKPEFDDWFLLFSHFSLLERATLVRMVARSGPISKR